MSRLAPKPAVARVVRVWRIPPGFSFALVEDVAQYVWIVESCPAGTHFWTVAQAAELPQGARTGAALRQAIRAGLQLEQRRAGQPEALRSRAGRSTPLPKAAAPAKKPRAQSKARAARAFADHKPLLPV